MRVVAVVVNWNGADQLAGCLDALLEQDHRPLEVLVVDNASSDASRQVLQDYLARQHRSDPPLRVRWNRRNRGFAGAVNDALAMTDADAVLTANFDVTPRRDFVSCAVAALAADPRRGAVQGKLLRTHRTASGEAVIDTTGHAAFRTRLFRNRGEGELDRGQWDQPGEVFGVSGALALYRRAMLDDVAVDLGDRREVLDEDLFAFFEDIDLDWRAAMRGWTVWYEPRAVAEHERGGAGPRRTRRVEQLNFQNRLLTVLKCDSPMRLARDLPGFLLTTVLKAAELLLTVPAAFVASMTAVRLVPRILAKRRRVHARATVPSQAVIDRWFRPFGYADWVRTWWRRVRRVPVGDPPRAQR
ncbi:MAG TPA: glycosyltransferase [Nitriliruptorales bacterium]|nr:glycosyltransferase [Nitriliruptorales bacterium]